MVSLVKVNSSVKGDEKLLSLRLRQVSAIIAVVLLAGYEQCRITSH